MPYKEPLYGFGTQYFTISCLIFKHTIQQSRELKRPHNPDNADISHEAIKTDSFHPPRRALSCTILNVEHLALREPTKPSPLDENDRVSNNRDLNKQLKSKNLKPHTRAHSYQTDSSYIQFGLGNHYNRRSRHHHHNRHSPWRDSNLSKNLRLVQSQNWSSGDLELRRPWTLLQLKDYPLWSGHRGTLLALPGLGRW